MTIFEHNQHQVEACAELAKTMRFRSFYARHSDRTITPAFDRGGEVAYWLLPATDSPISKFKRNSVPLLQAKEKSLRAGTMHSFAEHNFVPLPDLNACDSLKNHSIYVGGNWSVAPCCFIGSLSFTQESDHRYKNFLNALTDSGLAPADLVATDSRPVSAIVDQGFDWIYNRITTQQALTACFNHCHPDKANFKVSQATKVVRQH